MKRSIENLLYCLLIAAVLAGLSCAAQPQVPQQDLANQPQSQPDPEPAVPAEITEPVFEEVFDHYQAALVIDGALNYTVARGDTLSEIARRHYGGLNNVFSAGPRNGFYFPIIMLASPHYDLSDPDLIEPGITLVIPDLQRNLENPGSRKAIKEYLHDVALIYILKGHTSTAQGLNALSFSIPL